MYSSDICVRAPCSHIQWVARVTMLPTVTCRRRAQRADALPRGRSMAEHTRYLPSKADGAPLKQIEGG